MEVSKLKIEKEEIKVLIFIFSIILAIFSGVAKLILQFLSPGIFWMLLASLLAIILTLLKEL